ncbi:polyprenyl synthetase family protein [Porphyromonas gingivalis]|uniref:polyprenyl synthetase family protein n=1 Tax=Porphyromonas gingivalis TaxID=837 RepID=UPI0006AA3FA1|nr:polyprenyl synthetase family protein [Porphyromonas gingivalis]
MENLSKCLSKGRYNSISEYFAEMRMVSVAVKPHILDIVGSMKKDYPEMDVDFNYYYEKRILSKKLLLRPYVFKIFLELYGIEWREHVLMAAIVEIVNISTYQANLSFDNKEGINTSRNKNNQFISSFFSTMKVIESISTCSNYDSEQKYKILECIRESLEKIYYGQYIDMNVLTFGNLFLLNSESHFRESYLTRCALIGASLVEMIATIVAIIANKSDDKIFSFLKSFSYHFGLAGQVVNDIGDMIGAGKSYSDKYTDIYNGKLTYPIRELILGVNSLEFSTIIAFLESKGEMTRIKAKTLEYIIPHIKRIEKELMHLSYLGIDCSQLKALSRILTQSKYIRDEY